MLLFENRGAISPTSPAIYIIPQNRSGRMAPATMLIGSPLTVRAFRPVKRSSGSASLVRSSASVKVGYGVETGPSPTRVGRPGCAVGGRRTEPFLPPAFGAEEEAMPSSGTGYIVDVQFRPIKPACFIPATHALTRPTKHSITAIPAGFCIDFP